MDRAEALLISSLAIPLAGSVAVFTAQSLGERRWAVVLAKLGVAGGAVSGIVLAIMLAGRQGDAATVRLWFWNWLTFSWPQAPTITFGLEATVVKASLAGLTGILAFVALWKGASNRQQPLSDDAVLMISLLYLAGIWFVIAPNFAQSLTGWAGIAVSAVILIRISHQPETSAVGSESQSTAKQVRPAGQGPAIPELVKFAVEGLEWGFDQIRMNLIHRFPNWVVEQIELIDVGSTSTQLLAVLLGTTAILLTWLLNP